MGDIMLFENEQFNISKIYNVVSYAPEGSKKYTYPGKLPTYEVMFFYKGDVEVFFAGQKLRLTKGDILYLPKGLENNTYYMKVGEDFGVHTIYFDTKSPLPDMAVQISDRNELMKNYFERIFRIWVGKRDGYYYKTMQLAYEIFEQIRKMQQRYSPDKKLSRLLAAEEYISEHYCDVHFDYDKLTALSGLSYSYFKKLFIDKHSCPPVKYVTGLKINRACELLQTKKFTITEIAKICGFENVYYFSNVFKKLLGVSPNHYLTEDF